MHDEPGQAVADAPSRDEGEAWSRLLSEDEALERIRHHEGLLIVDLDETLYLHNSTETFIALARPAVLAAYLLRLLDMIRPWRWFGGYECRDNWRLLLVSLLLPWTYARWRSYCRAYVGTYVNMPLRDALALHQGDVLIASNGYRRLISPMLPMLGLPGAGLICCDMRRLAHRRNGKAALVKAQIGEAKIAASMVVTDSKTDEGILRMCAVPCLVKWRDAAYLRAFRDVAYLPGDYLARVKRPRQGALRKLAREDLLPWLFVALSITPFSPWNIVGMTLLFLSMWCVYEIGYYDNDICASRYEDDPKLTPEYSAFDGSGFTRRVWVAGILLGITGIFALQGFASVVPFGLWAVMLLLLRGAYWLYNRIDKSSRVWLYVVLQIFRSGAMVVVAAVGPVGYIIVIAQVVSRWMDYIIYRYVRTLGISKWPKTPSRTVRMVLCLLLIAPFALAGQWQALTSPAMIGLAWFAYIAVLYEIRPIVRALRRLDRNAPPSG